MEKNRQTDYSTHQVRQLANSLANSELEHQHSEERFRLLVDSVKDYAIFLLDETGIVTSWNEGARRIKGFTAEEIIGRHFSTFYTPDDIARSHPQKELEIAKAEGRYEEEGWRVKKDGSYFWASVVITALRGEDGELIGFAKVTRDLSEKKKRKRPYGKAKSATA